MQDMNGKKFIKEAEDFEAIVLCHEIDYLESTKYIDRVEELYYGVDVNTLFKIRQKHPHEK